MNAQTQEEVAAVAGLAVHRAMSAVQKALSIVGIAKLRTATTGNSGTYQFRGIDDVYNVVAPMIAEHGLLMIPRITERTVVERISGSNKALFVVTVRAEYDFVAVADGSTQTVGPFYGEAMDSGDKATNKAMSAAHKYAIFETFCVPVQGSDADADVHEVRAELTADQSGSLQKLRDASLEGVKALETAWAAIGKDNRKALAAHLDSLKDAAEQVSNAA